jgi:cutinase
MRSPALGAAALALLLTAACSTPATEATPSPTPSRTTRTPQPDLVDTACADVVVLGLRGSDQALDKNHASGQEVLRSVRAMSAELHRTSDATVRLEGIRYRAEYAANLAYYEGNIADGVTKTRARIAQLAKQCPGSKVALVGFSQGAQAVHELADGLTTSTAERIVLVAMIADPRRNPTDTIASWTYDKAARGPGKLGAGPALGPTLKGRAIEFCAVSDEICNWPPGGYTGALSQTHRHFYEAPAHAKETGHQLAMILSHNGV